MNSQLLNNIFGRHWIYLSDCVGRSMKKFGKYCLKAHKCHSFILNVHKNAFNFENSVLKDYCTIQQNHKWQRIPFWKLNFVFTINCKNGHSSCMLWGIDIFIQNKSHFTFHPLYHTHNITPRAGATLLKWMTTNEKIDKGKNKILSTTDWTGLYEKPSQ